MRVVILVYILLAAIVAAVTTLLQIFPLPWLSLGQPMTKVSSSCYCRSLSCLWQK